MAVKFFVDLSFSFFFVFLSTIVIKSLQDPMKKLVEKEERKRITQQESAEVTAEEPSQ